MRGLDGLVSRVLIECCLEYTQMEKAMMALVLALPTSQAQSLSKASQDPIIAVSFNQLMPVHLPFNF